MAQVYLGQIVHSKSLNEFEVFTNGFIAVKNGKIIGIGHDYTAWKGEHKEDAEEILLTSSQFLMPGFIDCHIHASQMPNIGLGLDKPLMEWLETYTFPLESQYSDERFAQNVYEKVVKATLANGTTLAVYFATIHKNSTILLAKEAIRQGQRAFVGKVSSDCNCPDFYVESYKESVGENLDFIKQVLALNSVTVKPIITPRFAITCSENLMKTLAKLAKEYNLHIQSHISENCNEISFAKKIFGKLYAQIYFDTGLLNDKCIMAHGVHLEDEELRLFKSSGASIAHCPSSNTGISSGLCDVRRILEAGIKVGLGTDVSAGSSVSIKDAILRALDVSQNVACVKTYGIKGSIQCLQEIDQKYKPIDYKQAIYLATLGGAEALSLSEKIGNFEVGKEFDALLIETNCFPIDNFDIPQAIISQKTPSDKLLELVQKFIYVGDDRNIKKVFVQGKIVKQ